MSGTTQVAWPGKPVAAQTGWPKGTLELVNDPLRTEGWNPWFSECSNDVNFFAFDVRDTRQVNQLIAKLAAIKGVKVQVRLNPTNEARGLAFTTVLDEGNGAAVVFSIGNQEQMDQWYRRLPEVRPGVRKFGVHEYKEPPVASFPTLTLYVGNDAIDLKALRIPEAVEVVADVAVAAPNGAATPDDPLQKAIDKFVSDHRKSAAPAKNQAVPKTR